MFKEIFSAFNQRKIKYLITGGVAVVLYGVLRTTADLDLIVDLEKKNLEKIWETLLELGYVPRIPIKKEEFNLENLKKWMREKNLKAFSFYHKKEPFKVVDLVLELNFEKLYKRKKIFKIDHLKVPVVSLDDLIKLKKKAGRKEDILDIERLKEIKKYGKGSS